MTPDRSDADVHAFYDRHCAIPGGVIIVHVFDSDGEETGTGVFSNLANAKAWTDERSEDAVSAVFLPYVIDAPEFGNVPAESMN